MPGTEIRTWLPKKQGIADTYTNSVDKGFLIYFSAGGRVAQKAIATAIATLAEAATIYPASSSTIIVYAANSTTLNIETGITISRGDKLFLSATEAGTVTNIAPCISQFVGFAEEDGSGAGGTVVVDLNIQPVIEYEFEVRPDLDCSRIVGLGAPTHVERGIYSGYSLPIGGANEELLFVICVPTKYNEASDVLAHADVWLDTANTGKKFQLELEWEHFPDDGIVPATSNAVDVETDTGTAAQYQHFHMDFVIDYDIDGPGNEIKPDEQLALRLSRIAAASDEIAGEVVVMHLGVVFTCNKLGEIV